MIKIDATPSVFLPKWTPELTGDGSFTFFSTEFGEAFHSRHGAREEAQYKFVEPTRLSEKAQQPIVRLLDICYGLGYNTAAALETLWAINPDCRIEWIGLELDPQVPIAAIDHDLLATWTPPIPQMLKDLTIDRRLDTQQFSAQLLLGDARQTIRQVRQSGFLADVIFLDPFSPPRCPQLWTIEFIAQVASCLQPTGHLATYSCSAAVRVALLAAGLQIGATPAVARRSPGTLAGYQILPPLSQQEQEHLLTRAAVPYRDPTQSALAITILQRRHQEQQQCQLEPTARWKKRWLQTESS